MPAVRIYATYSKKAARVEAARLAHDNNDTACIVANNRSKT